MAAPDVTRTLVVAAASKHSSTAEIADRIAADLAETLPAQWHVTRVEIADLDVIDGADAVVLGSAVYYGHWLRDASRVLEHLKQQPPAAMWLFSTGPVSDVEFDNDRTISADALADLAEGGEHMVFGGKLDWEQLSLFEHIVVKAVHALPGDHRDWQAIDAWAAHISSELGAVGAPVPRTKGTNDQGIGL